MPSLVAMLIPVSHIATADTDASLADDGPWAATMIVPGDDWATVRPLD
jgi:hypothetical protein